MTTEEKLVAAATALLDAGGDSAVTIRAVAAATGLSHNAPYKHFESRDALLAAAATADFRTLHDQFERIASEDMAPEGRLTTALHAVIDFSDQHPGRYQLLLTNPVVASRGGELEAAANEAFRAFAGLVESCQSAGSLPSAPSNTLAGIVFSTMHGLIAAQSSGRLQTGEGVDDVRSSMTLFIRLLSGRDQ